MIFRDMGQWAASHTKDMPRAHGADRIWGLKHSLELEKQTYGGTRRWLPENHTYMSAEMKEHFDGKIEVHPKPQAVIVHEQLRYVAEYQAWRDARNRPSVPRDPSKVHGVKRKSILNRLP
jgi:hypothetical protein